MMINIPMKLEYWTVLTCSGDNCLRVKLASTIDFFSLPVTSPGQEERGNLPNDMQTAKNK